MRPARRKRMLWIIVIVALLALAAALVLYALKQNINLFYTPQQITQNEVPVATPVRLGGMVVEGSIKQSSTDLKVSFAITDMLAQTTVHYQGSLPDLFREGQGVVVEGQLNRQGQFIASRVLAKHDENYMPPEVAATLGKPRAITGKGR